MARSISIMLVFLAVTWASCGGWARAQQTDKPASVGKLVRVTYPVADLIVPVEDHSAFDQKKPQPTRREGTQHERADALMRRIMAAVAPESWEKAGGPGRIQYFPLGQAFVISQTEDVQREINRLLTELRRLSELEISVQIRVIECSAATAGQIRTHMDALGQPVRAWTIEKPALGGRFVSMDDARVEAILNKSQTDRSAVITQAPKITVFDGQQAAGNGRVGDGPGLRFDVRPVVAPDRKTVRFSLHLEDVRPHGEKGGHKLTTTEAAGTFAVPDGRTLIWHVGESGGRNLFVLVTPRVVIEHSDESVAIWPRGYAEDQCEPNEREAADANKRRAIECRLKQPISLDFKELPLREAIEQIAIVSGIPVVPDTRALEEAKVRMDAPVSVVADRINLKNALNILLKPIRLTWIVEDGAVKITTESKSMGAPIRRTYKVGDIVDLPPMVEGQAPRKDVGEELMALIKNTVAKNSWEDMGSTGAIQYFPAEKKLVVTQNQEVQEELQLLLATLRKLQNPLVNVEVQFAHAPQGCWEDFVKWDGRRRDVENKPRFVVAKQDDAYWFVEARRSDKALASPPNLNLFEGQSVRLEWLEKRTDTAEVRVRGGSEQKPASGQNPMVLAKAEMTRGWRYDVQPVVSADRRTVRLVLAVENFFADGFVERSVKASGEFEVEANQTLIWHLGPAAGGEHLFVLVTPRIINREPEAEQPEEPSPPIPGR